jgi:hypothetical protein
MLPCMTLDKGHMGKNLYWVFFTGTRQRLNAEYFLAALGKEKVTSVPLHLTAQGFCRVSLPCTRQRQEISQWKVNF